jgi:hypothetical protein
VRASVAATFAATVVMLASSTAMAIEEPGFKLLEKDGSFELREYAPYVVAETRVEADFDDAAASPSSACSATSAATTSRSRKSR